MLQEGGQDCSRDQQNFEGPEEGCRNFTENDQRAYEIILTNSSLH